MGNRPDSRARVTAPTPGRANSTTPNATEIRPDNTNSARVPALSPDPNAAAISMIPPAKAQIPTTSTSTSAVGPGQTIAITPAASAITPSSRWPSTGPAVALPNARMACSPASMNAYTANKMTSARIVTPGQASAMIPTTMASTPSRISEVDADLNMTHIPFVRLGFPAQPEAKVSRRPGEQRKPQFTIR